MLFILRKNNTGEKTETSVFNVMVKTVFDRVNMNKKFRNKALFARKHEIFPVVVCLDELEVGWVKATKFTTNEIQCLRW